WVRLHPYNIASKVQIVVEHYRENVQPLLDGKAKAMVVVGSRKEAVRWQKAIRAYITRQNYPLGVLVAFSGEVSDTVSFPEAVSDPHQVYDLRAKLGAAGFYDDFEVDRVARVDLDPHGTQKQLDAAIAPVADRLLKRYKAAQQDKLVAEEKHDDKTARAAKDQ